MSLGRTPTGAPATRRRARPSQLVVGSAAAFPPWESAAHQPLTGARHRVPGKRPAIAEERLVVGTEVGQKNGERGRHRNAGFRNRSACSTVLLEPTDMWVYKTRDARLNGRQRILHRHSMGDRRRPLLPLWTISASVSFSGPPGVTMMAVLM